MVPAHIPVFLPQKTSILNTGSIDLQSYFQRGITNPASSIDERDGPQTGITATWFSNSVPSSLKYFFKFGMYERRSFFQSAFKSSAMMYRMFGLLAATSVVATCTRCISTSNNLALAAMLACKQMDV